MTCETTKFPKHTSQTVSTFSRMYPIKYHSDRRSLWYMLTIILSKQYKLIPIYVKITNKPGAFGTIDTYMAGMRMANIKANYEGSLVSYYDSKWIQYTTDNKWHRFTDPHRSITGNIMDQYHVEQKHECYIHISS